jgi:hypothetical protein
MDWHVDRSAEFQRRLGPSPQDLGVSSSSSSCPEIWELTNGDFVMIGRDETATYAGRLPAGVTLAEGERVFVLPRATVVASKSDIPDA